MREKISDLLKALLCAIYWALGVAASVTILVAPITPDAAAALKRDDHARQRSAVVIIIFSAIIFLAVARVHYDMLRGERKDREAGSPRSCSGNAGRRPTPSS
ncbi:MAG: hypothetical protein AAB867_00420 [Patescibacteria group bacterium]